MCVGMDGLCVLECAMVCCMCMCRGGCGILVCGDKWSSSVVRDNMGVWHGGHILCLKQVKGQVINRLQ